MSLEETINELEGSSFDILAKIQENKDTVTKCNAENCKLNINIQDVNRRLAVANEHLGDLDVTDHAIIRYMERVMKFDIKSLRAKISKEAMPMYSIVRSDGRYPLSSSCRAVVEGGKIVTILN